MMAAPCQTLPVVRVGEIPSEDHAQRWLVEQLWGASSVGLIGGAPKCSKTWLGLDLALSVATGTACLGTYAVPEAGPVLVYLAEDALPIVRQRVAGMARHRGLDLDRVEIHVITAPSLRLDRDPHRGQLMETTRRLRPRLLLLDPLVRLHGVDENHATEVAGLLAYFRLLQRKFDLSVILVHHTRKKEKQTGLQDLVMALLTSGTTLTRAKLRDTLSVKNERLGEALESLEQAGRIRRTPIGWQREN
jgi:RecA-family ATPase